VPEQRPTPPANQPPEPRDGYVAVGWVRAPHGIRGELRIELLTDSPERFVAGNTVWIDGSLRKLRSARPHRATMAVIELEGTETRNDAEALRGALLEVPEGELADLDEDEYYRFEIVGLDVFDAEGRALGKVERIIETGANDVYAVVNDDGELLVPAIDSVVREVDLEGGRIVVELLEGLERRPPPKAKRARQSSGRAGAGNAS
jgi:16S rRNA processing protein RimM